MPLAAAFAIVGAVIVSSNPRNSVGWLFCVLAFVVGELEAAQGYATYALVTRPESLPGADLIAWLGVWPIECTSGLLVLSIVLFPHGRLPSPRWRPAAGMVVVLSGALTLLSFFWNVNLTNNFPQAHMPFVLPGLATARAFYPPIQGISILLFLVPVAATAIRYRRGSHEERLQLKWLLLAVVVLGVSLVVAGFGVPDPHIVFSLTAPGIPIAAGVAIQRYRLYDIDRIISRSLGYAAVTALLAGLYFGLVLLVSVVSPLATDSPVVVAVSTLLVAAAFGPVRRRIQSLVDRRFNRARYDAARTLDDFATRLRDEVDIGSLSRDLVEIVDRTFQPETLTLWLRGVR